MKKLTLTLIVLLSSVISCLADEGMWLPQLLAALNEKDMKAHGMKMNASDIYSISKSSLKDAIVSFGGFCTGEVISDKGLLLTNHHCGFELIQRHSSVKENYIKDGFWAYNYDQELQNPGLFVTFIVRIEEVTSAVLKDIPTRITEADREKIINQHITEIKANYKKEPTEGVFIRSFFASNKYFLFVTETFHDVRLVGAPPSAIGSFGQDTDNWSWPRHTGDFSLFRIYADKNNKPASYSPDNVPYKPKRSLTISLNGVKENDFTLVFGFPGNTKEYLPASAIKQIADIDDPSKIEIREKILNAWRGFMRNDEHIQIQYASKYARLENYYKKWQGEVLGLYRTNAVAKKQQFEKQFMLRVNQNREWREKYGNLLQDLNAAYQQMEPYVLARNYRYEIIPRIELFSIVVAADSLRVALIKDSSQYQYQKQKLSDKLSKIFKDYNYEVDKKIFSLLIPEYINRQQPQFVSDTALLWYQRYHQSGDQFSDSLYTQSQFSTTGKIEALLTRSATEFIYALQNDPAYRLYEEMKGTYITSVSSEITDIQYQINLLQRQYMEAQMTVFPEKKFYPDANSTLRVTYGNVKGYTPRDGVYYKYQTFMEGIIEKYKPGDYEFDVPQKLIDLYNRKDFGPYAENGKQPVCFIASNHTTGGNSGSPALDAYGNLIGLNFDRGWEGTMSDINYDISLCRNIMVDIRYVMFIIDKYANAQNIISEIKTIKGPAVRSKK